MEETAQRDAKFRENVKSAAEEAISKSIASVTPPTESPLEIAEQMMDLGGKNEGSAPSKSFLERLKARITGEADGQKEILEKAA